MSTCFRLLRSNPGSARISEESHVSDSSDIVASAVPKLFRRSTQPNLKVVPIASVAEDKVKVTAPAVTRSPDVARAERMMPPPLNRGRSVPVMLTPYTANKESSPLAFDMHVIRRVHELIILYCIAALLCLPCLPCLALSIFRDDEFYQLHFSGKSRIRAL